MHYFVFMKMNFLKKKRIMDIKTYGDEVLTKVANPIPEIDKDIINLVERMKKTMFKADGVGLAAPQVGLSMRLIILGVPNINRKEMTPITPGELQLLPLMPLALINPKITVTTNEESFAEEGCLSVPHLYARVRRPEKVMLSAQFVTGEMINIECGGFLARAIQHEIDHLNGILFVDKLDSSEYDKIKSELKIILKEKKKSKKR